MKRPMGQIMRLTAALGVFACASVIFLVPSGYSGSAQSIRKIKIVVGVPPGGAADTLARLLAEEISRAQALTIVVENRPGAVNIIATEVVSRAAPDGNTVLLTTPAFILNSHLRKLNYDPFTSFDSICYLARTPMVIAVNSSSPYRTLPDLVNMARSKPGEMTLGAAGPATPAHIAFETLRRAADVNMIFVPYPGGPSAVVALLGNHVTSALSDYPGLAEQLRAGRLRALAVASGGRIESLPEVPTVAEYGYQGAEADLWFGLAAPAKTPKETLSELAGWFSTALRKPDLKEKLVGQGLYSGEMCGEKFSAFLRRQYDNFGRIIREANIKAE
jgi:tripartite-type tricarboxylate transporter receptor subunit TctC